METRPNMNKYRGLASASVIDIIASINLVAGVACIVLGIMGNNALSGTAGIISGISCMVVACFLFIISNIAQDIHWQAYMTEYYGEEAANYHEQSLRKLQSIEWMIRQMDSPWQAQYSPVPNPYTEPMQTDRPVPQVPYPLVPPAPNQYTEPTQTDRSEPQVPADRPEKKIRYVGTITEKRFAELPEEDSFRYDAQYRRPAQDKKPVSEQKTDDAGHDSQDDERD